MKIGRDDQIAHIETMPKVPRDSWGWKVPNFYISKMTATAEGDAYYS